MMTSENTGLLQQAYALVETEKFDEANNVLEQLGRNDPDVLNTRAVICARRGDFSRGVEFLRQAYAARPGDPTIRGNLETMLRAAAGLLSDTGRNGDSDDKLARIIHRAMPSETHFLPTSKCNLRCVYCGISGGLSDPATHIDMDPRIIRKIVSLLQKHPVKHLTFSGGEITIMKDWMETVDLVRENGLDVSLICNGTRLFSDEELGFLTKFNAICFSIDSPDVELNKRLRPKVSLPNIVFNILRFRAFVLLHNLPLPKLSISCVISDENMHTIPDLVALVHTMGLNVLALNEVTEINGGTSDARSVRHWARYTPAECREIVAKAMEIGRRCGVDVAFFPGFLDAIAGVKNDSVAPEGMTRLCSDPWSMLLFKPNGDIHTCCTDYPPVAHVDQVESLEDIFFSPANLRCKEELLTGKLHESCRKCTMKPVISPSEIIAARAAEMLC